MNKAFKYLKQKLTEDSEQSDSAIVEKAIAEGKLKDYVRDEFERQTTTGPFNRFWPPSASMYHTSALFRILDHPAITAEHISGLFNTHPVEIFTKKMRPARYSSPTANQPTDYQDGMIYLHSLQHPKIARAGYAGASALMADIMHHIPEHATNDYATSDVGGNLLSPLSHFAMNPGQSPRAMKHNLNALFGVTRKNQDNDLLQRILTLRLSPELHDESNGIKVARHINPSVGYVGEFRIIGHMQESPSTTISELGRLAQKKLNDIYLDIHDHRKENKFALQAPVPKNYFEGHVPVAIQPEMENVDFEEPESVHHEGNRPIQFTDEEIKAAQDTSRSLLKNLYGEDGAQKLLEKHPWRL